MPMTQKYRTKESSLNDDRSDRPRFIVSWRQPWAIKRVERSRGAELPLDLGIAFQLDPIGRPFDAVARVDWVTAVGEDVLGP